MVTIPWLFVAFMLATVEPVVGQALPQPKIGSCPSGYYESGEFCAPMKRDAPAAIPKGKGQCPSNWMQSGAYCIDMRRPAR
jgi:hypothetical protein